MVLVLVVLVVVVGDRPKNSENFWPGEKEERRPVGEEGGEFSFDIVPRLLYL